jgi:hypothetical protein
MVRAAPQEGSAMCRKSAAAQELSPGPTPMIDNVLIHIAPIGFSRLDVCRVTRLTPAVSGVRRTAGAAPGSGEPA